MYRFRSAPFPALLIVLTLSASLISAAGVLLVPPTGLSATVISGKQVDLTWTDTNSQESGVLIQRSTGSFTNFKKIATVGADVTTYRDLTVAPSKTYYYRVRAVGPSKSKSLFGNIATATTPAPDSVPPAVFLVSPAAGTTITTPQTVMVEATALDNVAIARVDFYDGTTLKSSTSSAPFSYSWSVTSVDNGTHNLSARAVDTAGNSTVSPFAGISVSILGNETNPPSAPGNVTATVSGCSQINLAWSPSHDGGGSGLAGYNIYGNGTLIGTSAITSFVATGLAPSTSYSFIVVAYDNAGNISAQSTPASATTPSCPDTTAPTVPAGLTGTAASCSRIDLSWTASTDSGGSGLSGYRIFRNGTQVGVSSTPSFSSTGLSASTAYSFTVAAFDNAGNVSAQSTAASATTPSCPDTTAPSVPAGLTGTAVSCSQVDLSWSASTDTVGSGLAGYRIFRNGIQVGTSSTSSYSSTGLSGSTAYSFTVAAYDNAGNVSAQSTASSATTPACADTTAPSVPGGLTGTAASCSQVDLSWSASTDTGGSGLAGYRIFRNGTQVGTSTTASYSNTGLSASTAYSFTVAAFDNAGNVSAQSTAASATTPSCPDITAPSVPGGLTSTAASCNQVDLSWSASTDTGGSGLAGYRIFRNGTQVGTSTTASYPNTGLSASTAYSFTVAAYDNAGNVSSQSTASSATTPSCPDTTAPSVPGGLTSTAATCSQVNLAWSASTDAGGSGLAGYRIFRNGTQVGTSTTASYSNTGLSASTAYSFSVAAYDNAGNVSAQSSATSATTPSCPDTTAPSVPGGLASTAASCTQVNLAWSASTDTGGSGLTGYRIFRDGTQVGTSSTPSYSNTGLSASTAYSFTVAAYDNAGNVSAQSAAASATTPACADTTTPSVPGGLTSTVASCSQVNLAWSASTDTGGSGLAGYRIFRNGTQVGTSSTPSYSSTGLSASTAYSFTVAAYDNAGNVSAQSAAASATTPACADTTTPSVPGGLTSTVASCSQLNLAWSASTDTGGSGLAGYRIFRNGTQVGTSSTPSYSSTGLSASTAYSFTVAAYDNAGNVSAQSAAASATTPACADTTAPSVPGGLTSTAASCTQVNLAWSASTDTGGSGLAGYRIFRNGTQVGTSSTPSYSSTGLSASTAYSFTVAAYDNAGNVSPQSAAASATTPACADTTAPSVPGGLTSTAASCTQVNLAWSASTDTGGSGLAGYRIFRNGTQVGTSTTASYSNTGLSASTAYSFTVAAYDNAGNVSSQSTASSATTPSCPDTTAPSVPGGLTSTVASCTQINLAWSASTDTGGSGLAGYRIFRNGTQVGTSTTASYSNTGLSASTAYSFTVAAYDNAGNVSSQSTASSATTPSCPDTTAPSVPGGLTSTVASCTQVNLAWSASTDTGGSGLAGYRIFRNGTQVGTSTTASYSNTGLSASTAYSFTVAAYDNAGNVSAQSTASSATTPSCPDTTAPSVPGGLTSTVASCTQVNLAWSASTDTGGSGLAGYRIFRNGTQVGTSTTASYSNTGLSASTAYSFTVAAYDNAGNVSAQSTASSATTPSCPDTTAPSVPGGLTSTAASCSQVNLAWSASTDTGGSGLAGYRIFRNGTQVGTSSTPSYSSTGLSASTGYSFTVAAYDNAGNVSAQSAASSATTPSCPDTTAPSVPGGLTSTAASCTQVNLAWSASTDTGGSGLAGYRIFRNGTQVGTSTTASYSNTGLSASTAYSFTVAAYDNAGNVSAQSTASSATTPSCPDTTAPSVPGGLTSTVASCTQVNLAWSASTDTGGSGLAGYRIFRNGTQVGTSTTASYSNTGLSASTAYSFTVAAYDNAGNVSAQSTASSATTPSCPDTTAPSVPGGLTSTVASCTQVNLAWSASTDTGGSGLAGYRIFRNGTQVGTSSTPSYSSTGLSASTAYSFTVAAYDNAGNVSSQSTASSATTPSCPDTTAPSVPGGLTSTVASCTQINLAWSASTDTGGSGLAGYRIFRNGTQVGTSTTASYSNTGLSASTAYSFTVAAYDNAGNVSSQSTASSATTPSCPDTTAPSVPGGLTSTVASCTQVNLAWSASTDTGGSGLAGYRIFRNGTQVGTSTTASYSNTGLSASTAYSFTVAAYDNAGNVSSQSTASSATTPSCPDTTAPSVPGGLTSTVASCTQVNLAWSASTDTGGSGLAGYRIFRNGTQVGTSTTASYSSTGLSASTAYSFTVAAYDNAGNVSAQSTASSATTPSCPDTTAPSVPGGLTSTAASCTQVNLAWSASTDTGGSGLAGYRIFRNGTQAGTSTTASYSSTGLSASTTYSFTVAAYDNAGNVSAQSSARSATTPACTNQAPTADAGADKTSTVGTAVSLSGAASRDADGSIVSYAWDFADGTTGTGVSVSHTWNTAGTYYVTLTVTDNGGATDTDQAYVDVVPSTVAGQFDSVVRYGGTGGDLGYRVAVASNGDIVVAGSFQSSISFGGQSLTSAGSDDIFLARFSASGTHLWSKRIGGTGTDSASDIALDTNGDVVLVGYFSGSADFGAGSRTSAGAYDIFVAKYASNGSPVWSKTFGATDTDAANGVAVDATGNVIVTGTFRWTVNFGIATLTSAMFGAPDLFIAKYAADGTAQWARNYSGPSSDYGKSVAVDSAGNILLTGGFLGSLNLGGLSLAAAGTTSEDFFVAKFNPAGEHIWSRKFGNIGADTSMSLAVDGSDNVLVTGQFALTVDFGGLSRSAIGQDVYVLKLAGAGGSVLWARHFTSTANEMGNAITTDRAGNVLVTGYIDGSVDFGGGTIGTAGSADIFVLKLSPAGSHLWSHRYGATGFEQGLGITVDDSDKPLVVGYFKGTVNFGGGPIVANGTAADIFLLQLWP